MRVVNDREERPGESTEWNVLGVISHGLLAALGMVTVLWAPMPLIMAELRLTDPWPKVAAVLGAIVALLVFKLPLGLVVISFVIGVYLGDGVRRQTRFWELLAQTLAISLLVGVASLFFYSQWERVGFTEQWVILIDAIISQFQASFGDNVLRWDVMKTIFLREGPFIYLSTVILAAWFSIGAAAHFGWIENNETYSAEGLRKIRLPGWFCIGFLVLTAAVFSGQAAAYQYVLNGLFRVAGAIMLVQGCVCLSDVLATRMARPAIRTVVYSLAIIVGFYALMGMAVAAPWFYRRKNRLSQRLEEAL